MLQKVLTLILSVSVFSVASANVAANPLKQAFDSYHRALTVEWDGKDKKFYEAQVDKFKAEIEKLRAQGLTSKEMIEFAKSNLVDAQKAKDIDTFLTLISINKMSEQEAMDLFIDTFGKSYKTGANFSGAAEVAGVVLGSAAIVLLLYYAEVIGPTRGCYINTECIDYFDYWGYYSHTYCEDYTYCY